MRYDFDTIIDRRNTGSSKWDMSPLPVRRAGVPPLSVADMEFMPAPEIQDALIEAARQIPGYTLPDTAYLDAVAGWMKRRHGWEIDPNWVCPANGVVAALSVAVRAFTEPNDAVVIQPPVYYPFHSVVEKNGRKLLENPLVKAEDGYRMDFEQLERLCARAETKMMILCSPHNPVGRVWTREELARLGTICAANGVLVVSDEIHFDILLPGQTHTVFSTLPGMLEKSIVCTSPSKTFNLAGLQCANILIADENLRARFKRRRALDGLSGVPAFGRAACIAAYTRGEKWADEMLRYVAENFAFLYDFAREKLPEISVEPAQGTYLAWMNCRGLDMRDDDALESFCVNDALLALDPGYIFGKGGQQYLRWNLAVPRTVLQSALMRFEYAVHNRHAYRDAPITGDEAGDPQ